MGIFGGFKAKFSKDSNRKKQKKEEVGVVCTSYRVFSEFSDDQYPQPSHYSVPKPSTSGTQPTPNRNGLKAPAPIIKTPSSSSTLQEEAQHVEIVTIRNDKNISVRKIKAKSQNEVPTIKPEPPKSKRFQSASDLTTTDLPLPPPRPPAESKPTPKARKSVENLAQSDSNGLDTDDSYEYPSYNDLTHPTLAHLTSAQGSINLRIETDDNYIQPVNIQTIKYNSEGIYEEAIYNSSPNVEVTTLQNSEGTFLQSKAKKVKKEKGKRREEKVLGRASHSVDNNNPETSTISVRKEETITKLSTQQHVTSSLSVESVEVNSNSIKPETQLTNDYGSYFSQKATSLGYSTSQAASIFFQDDDDDDDVEDGNHQDKSDENRNSWKGVRITEMTADDDNDENRRISGVEC